MLFLGIGTGHCGLRRLTRVVSKVLKHGVITYECPVWRHNFESAKLGMTRHIRKERILSGDSAHYWLPKLPQIIEHVGRDNLKLVLVVRDMRDYIETIEMKWEYNHFTRKPRKGRLKYLPYIEGDSIAECGEKYWKDYNAEALKYDPFVLQMQDLNKPAKLYEYLGLKNE